MITTAVVVTIYKDLEALKLIIESLGEQTVLPNEIVIAEDNNSDTIANFVRSINIPNVKIRHTFQPDNGWQRNKSSNNALRAVESDYIIWIDGDCVPFPTLVESHMALREERSVLCGRRTEPGAEFSKALRSGTMKIKEFLDNYYTSYFKLKADEIRHYDDGVCLKPNSFLWKLIHNLRKKENHIVGCHWSSWKKDLVKINGFDEDFVLPTTGEDTDIERRLRHFGIKMKSCRYSANVIHLYHKKVFNPEITAETEALMDTKSDIFICINGLIKK